MDLDKKRNQTNAINNRDKWINPLKQKTSQAGSRGNTKKSRFHHCCSWIIYTLISCLMYHKNLPWIVLLSCNRQMLFCCIPIHRNAMHFGYYLEFAIWRHWLMCLVSKNWTIDDNMFSKFGLISGYFSYKNYRFLKR